jgi:cytochrome P450
LTHYCSIGQQVTQVLWQKTDRAAAAAAGVARCRVAGKDMSVGPYKVPAGTVVGTPLFAIQNCAANWDKPDDFIPERWLDVPVENYVYDSTTKTSGGKRGITFMPFSEGPRNCVGQVGW